MSESGFGVVKRLADVPPQSVVQSEIGGNFVRVLRIESEVFCPRIKQLRTGLRLNKSGAPIRKSAKSFPVSDPEKVKPAIRCIGISLIDLNVTDIAAKFQRVPSDNFRKIVGDLIGVVVLAGGTVWKAESSSHLIKTDRGDAFIRIIGGDHSEPTGDIPEIRYFSQALRPVCYSESKARVTNVRLVHGVGPKQGGVIDHELLRSRDTGCGESRYIRRKSRVRVQEVRIIKVIIE